MRVDITDATAEQPFVPDELQHLRICSRSDQGQVREAAQDRLTLAKMSEGEFTNDKGMRENTAIVEQGAQFRIRFAQMVYPDRGVDKDHRAGGRRRGGAFACLSLPPRRASRRALSRSMRAFRPSRTRPDFSFRPVNAWASATSLSSRARVVRIRRKSRSKFIG